MRRFGWARVGWIPLVFVWVAGCEAERSDSLDLSCVKLKKLRAVTTNPSAVSMLFTVETCDGEPVPYGVLETADFEILEDDREISSEAHREVLRGNGMRAFVTLLLDVSDSTRPNTTELIDGAKAFVRELLEERGLNVSVGIQLFDGGPDPIVYQRPISDATRLHSRLETLMDYEPPDGGATNLHGALLEGVTGLQQWQHDFTERNLSGALTTGYLVLFTDGGDSAGRVDAGAAKVAVETARRTDWTEGALPAVQTFAVALRGEDYSPEALDFLLGGTEEPGQRSPYVVEAASPAELQATFEGIADRIAAQVESTFLLAYCSSKREGVHTVSVGVKPLVSQEGNWLDFTFNAAGFDGGCNEEFFRTACEDKGCGGFNCGACDDEMALCNPTTLQCENYCLAENLCDGESHTNPLGYEQVCDFGPTVTACSGQCVDTDTHTQHCGECDNVCAAEGSSCVEGQCQCSGMMAACSDRCADLQTDPQHCGVCENICPQGVQCQAGVCPYPGGGIYCFGAFVDPDNDDAHCGGCGRACEPGASCEIGQCVTQ